MRSLAAAGIACSRITLHRASPQAGTVLSEPMVGRGSLGGKAKHQLFAEQGTLKLCH